MTTTRSGQFPIGFRRGGSDWQKNADSLLAFIARGKFAAIDLPALEPQELRIFTAAGVKIGSVDLVQPWTDLMSADAGQRRAAVEKNVQYAQSAAQLGVRNFFTVCIPQQVQAPRADNFKLAVQGYGELCAQLAKLGAHLVIEGWPGPANSSIGCTPADLRALLKEIPQGCGINFDPSHLLRMHIDPIRFLQEFAPFIHHVHAKDTQWMVDDCYDHGTLQDATFAPRHKFGSFAWRYCIPGHGCAPWIKLLTMLKNAGYQGVISVELEDENFMGSAQAEQRGLSASRHFLEHV